MTQHNLVSQGHHIIEVSRSHSGTPQSLRLLLTRNRPVAEIFMSKYTKLEKRDTSLLPEGFKPAVPKIKRPYKHVLDGASTGDLLIKNNSKE